MTTDKTQPGCTASYCWITGKNGGQATQAGCSCLRPLPVVDRIDLEKRIRILENRIATLTVYIAGTDDDHQELIEEIGWLLKYENPDTLWTTMMERFGKEKL